MTDPFEEANNKCVIEKPSDAEKDERLVIL